MDDLMIGIDVALLEEVLRILLKAGTILEYFCIGTLQSTFPAYCSCWSELPSTDNAAKCILKRNSVSALDEKMWVDIATVYIATSYLDPSLKSVSFFKDGGNERTCLGRQNKLQGRILWPSCQL